jgi:murein DD-endopeptidase MepM/ murein hydrolase activator NlpD
VPSARRDNGVRQHAGCDLYATAGDEVLAVADGKVIRSLQPFDDIICALNVEHPGIGIVRYGEVSRAAVDVVAGADVVRGQVSAYIGRMQNIAQAMLHFELCDGSEYGPLTDREGPPFMRRSDLVDPTIFLDGWQEGAVL